MDEEGIDMNDEISGAEELTFEEFVERANQRAKDIFGVDTYQEAFELCKLEKYRGTGAEAVFLGVKYLLDGSIGWD